ncbi:hypothetical protein BKA70DRAFT_575633 [Coprinopsis sp. MPI-PUGE-AT-0042]|nr:hypothetical protein BKA70DRAFT_575633 [Coprinopsis sp. MPI-PUGE-AT-0042]
MAQNGLCISEVPEIPRQRSRCFYSALFSFILPLWSVIPISWAFVIWSLYTGRIWLYRYPGLTLFTGALVEVFFSVYHYHLAQRIASLAPKTPPPAHEIRTAYTRLLKTGLAQLPADGGDHESLWDDRPGSPEEEIVQLEYDDHRAIDFRNCLRTWFKKVPWSHVKLADARKWLYWSIFNAKMDSYETLEESERLHLDTALEMLQKRMGCKFEDGESMAHVEPMRLTVDPVRIVGRPFIFYLLIKSMNWMVHKYYGSQYGVRHGCHDGLEYLLRVPEGWSNLSPASPLVFIHGLGMGPLQYHLLFTHLFETITDRPILVLLQPHISQDIFHRNFLHPMGRHETSQRLASLIEALGWTHVEHRESSESESQEGFAELGEDEKEVAKAVVEEAKGVTILSHSNGSYVHAWMLKEHPHLVKRSCFVDPVTFCSWEGDVCYNFIYRAPMTGMELIMKYFVGMELGVANLLQRNFDWVANSLWFEEIPNARDPSKTFFVLGGKDSIVHSQRVRKYLRSHGVMKNLLFDDNAIHGDALRTGSTGHTEVLKWLYDHP